MPSVAVVVVSSDSTEATSTTTLVDCLGSVSFHHTNSSWQENQKDRRRLNSDEFEPGPPGP